MANPETNIETTDTSDEKQKLNLQVKVDKTSTCKRHVTVTIPREDIDRYYHDAFDEFVPKAEVPGFRPGRAPRKLVESRFKEQMTNQVKGSLLMDCVTQVAEDSEFSAISEPELDFEAVEVPDTGPMSFEFDIEVRPEFDLPEWKGLKLKRPAYEYSDEEVEQHMNKLLARYGKTVNKEGAVEANDILTIRIAFQDGDKVLSEIPEAQVAIKPILSFRDGNIEDFKSLVLGKKIGDRVETRVTISNAAEVEELRGKEVTAAIEIVALKKIELPELSPGFLDSIGGFVDVDELKDAVREELERQLGYFQQRRIREQITTQLIKDANWDLPEDMLRRQYRRELERSLLELRRNNFSDEDIRHYQNQIRQNSMNATAAALKEHFILERLAEDQEFEAADHDYDNEIRLIAEQSQDSPRRVRARLEKRGQMDALRNQIVERKVIDLITSHAEFTDEPFTPRKDDTVALDYAITGQEDEVSIPDAKYAGEGEQIPGSGQNPSDQK